MVVPLLALIAKVNPVVCVIENVVPYANTGSMCIIRNFLRDFGYSVHEEVLDATDWNAHEQRKRLCVVAVSAGMTFEFAKLHRPVRAETVLAQVLEEMPDDAPCWSTMQGLKDKEIRDRQAGKGFKMQIIKPGDTSCPTLTKGYAKVRSTDPKVQHPRDAALLRQLLPSEHAAMKGVPRHLIDGSTATLAHELLGQSICYQPFVAVGRCIGHMFNAFSGGELRTQALPKACG